MSAVLSVPALFGFLAGLIVGAVLAVVFLIAFGQWIVRWTR